MKYLTEDKRKKLNTDIYAITAEEYSLGRGNIKTAADMLAAGIKIIQYREKEKTALEKYRECRIIREMARQKGALFIVNDDLGIALAVEADGVHVGQDDLPPAEIRKITGEKMIIGLSTHSPEQARRAVAEGVADYLGVGPIYKTETKKDVGDPVGLAYLEYVAANIPLPFVAIGGIKESNILEVWQKGARCIAMSSEIAGAADIADKIASIRRVLK
ncbi:MAG: thiamine phosphate synthase [Dethiobacter sp.]|jgi:thiamine-phosphate pyrophosphorylase|nr:thiamine phosphate synthase [Dethiobacter sp.]